MNPKTPKALAELDMTAPPTTKRQARAFAQKFKPAPLREQIIALCRLTPQLLAPNVIQDVFAGDDTRRRTEVHREIAKMIDDGTFGITVDWKLRLRGA